MPNLILDLEVNRVDLVDEGANSEAFIRLYKRKEMEDNMNFEEILAKMKPEHAQVVQAELEKAKGEIPEEVATELAKAKTDLVTAQEELAKAKEPKTEDKTEVEDVIKGLDPAVQEVFKSLKAQKDAAEEVVKSLNAKKAEDEAIAKAKELKALPVEEAKLVDVVKGVSPEVFEILKSAAAAIENGGLLEEVGKSKAKSDGADAWSMIEKKAGDIMTRDSVTKQKAIAQAISENPELYREYLSGGVK